MDVRFTTVGDTAFNVEFGEGIDRPTNAHVMALHARLKEAGVPGLVETVPTFRSLLVVYDPSKVDLEALLKAFWENHDPTTPNRQGNDVGTQYRSAIYPTTDAQLAAAEDSRARYQQALKEAGFGEISTEIRPAGEAGPFYYAEDHHQGYLAKNPWGYCNHGFCQVAYNPAAHGQDAPTKVELPES